MEAPLERLVVEPVALELRAPPTMVVVVVAAADQMSLLVFPAVLEETVDRRVVVAAAEAPATITPSAGRVAREEMHALKYGFTDEICHNQSS